MRDRSGGAGAHPELHLVRSGAGAGAGGPAPFPVPADHPRPSPFGPHAQPVHVGGWPQGHGQAGGGHGGPGGPGGLSHELLEVNDPLPDILYSHLVPPHRLRQNQHRQHRRVARSDCPRAQSNRARRAPPQTDLTQLDHYEEDDDGCCRMACFKCVTVVTKFKWVLVFLALLGICCVVIGIVLGALHMTIGSSFLTLSLMFIGLGVMLVVVVGVGWRCTPTGHEPCHLLFGLGRHSSRSPGGARYYSGCHEWYGGNGIMYPEFRYRRPPPSYNASMQDYQQQLVRAQIEYNAAVNNSNAPAPDNPDNYSLPSSPPPTYRSHTSSTGRQAIHITFPPSSEHFSSRPPSYRSHVSSGAPGEHCSSSPSCSRPTLPLDSSQRVTLNAQAHSHHRAADGVVQVTVHAGDHPGFAAATAHHQVAPHSATSSASSTLRYPPHAGTPESMNSPGSLASRSSTLASHHQMASSSASPSTPGSASSTLFRAQQAVQYLDNVLDTAVTDQPPAGTATESQASIQPGKPAGVSVGVQVSNETSDESKRESSPADRGTSADTVQPCSGQHRTTSEDTQL